MTPMEKIPLYRNFNQAITNDDVRLSIMNVAGKTNGGLKDVARKSGMGQSALWNQMNRNAGVLAYTIPLIVRGTGDVRPLAQLARACGYRVVPILEVSHLDAALREIEIAIAIDEGNLLEETEKSIDPESPGGSKIVKLEYRRIKELGRELIRKIRSLMLLAEEGG